MRLLNLRRFYSATCMIVVAFLCASLVGVVESAPASAASATKSTIVLGDIGEDSGPVGANVASAKVAAQAWQGYINANGGLNGHPVKIIYGDDAGSNATALSLATQMVTQDHVVAMFGLHAQDPEAEILSYLQKQNVPAIGVGNSGNVADASSSAMYNPTTTSTAENQAEVALFKKLDPKITKVGIIYCAEASACSTESAAATKYAPSIGMKVVYNGEASLSAPSYTAQVVAAKSAGAQALLAIESPGGTSGIIRDAGQQGWYPYVEGSSVSYSSNINAGEGLPIQSKLVLSSITVPWSVSPLMSSYRTAVKKYANNGVLGVDGASVWVGGALFQQIGKTFGSTVTSASITKSLLALKGVTLGGLTPPLTFPASNNRAAVNACVNPVQYKSDGWTAPLGTTRVCTKVAS
jgi:branched-chain amino acid transport system substrate-binding protein